MKDKQKAIENGLVMQSDKEKFCTGCHNSESPNFKEFKFDDAWALIKHPKQ
jgi:predicted CXXCH cytochrome family protein